MITTTTSSRKALQLLAKETYAVVVSDYLLQDMDGIALLQQTRHIAPETLRILLTGYAKPGVENRVVRQAVAKHEEFRDEPEGRSHDIAPRDMDLAALVAT